MERVDVARPGEPSPGSSYEAPCYRIPALAVPGDRLLPSSGAAKPPVAGAAP